MEKEQLIALVKKSQAGDQNAIENLLQYAHTSVSYQCRKMLGNEQDAEDMTQEVLVTIYTKLDTLQEPAAFWKWANQITATRCINALNRTHVEYQFAEDEDGHSVLDNLEELDEQVIPDKAIDNAETARMIEEIVEGLPDAQRAATLMFYYNEMSVKEIAQTMQVSENTVKSRLNYARKAIKEKVLDYEKQGVKLYGLSPLPFLLYFLRLAAQNSADKEAAGIMVAEIMAAEGAAVGIAAGTGGAAATVGATATAGGVASAAGGAAATGIFAGISAKVVAGILAAVVTVGSVAAVVIPNTQADTTEPTTVPTEVTSVMETESIPETEAVTEPFEVETTEPATEATTASVETEPAQAPTESTGSSESTEYETCATCGTGQIIPVNLTQDPCATRLEFAFQCNHCGTIAGYSYPPGNGHTYGISEDGQYEICTVCGEILGPTGIGHGGVTTETEPDVTEVPETETDESTTLPDDAGSDSAEESTEATTCAHGYSQNIIYSCEEGDTTVYTCVYCGDSFSNQGKAKGHNYVYQYTVSPSCELDGYDYYECTNTDCNSSNQQNIIPATGHSFDESGICTICNSSL